MVDIPLDVLHVIFGFLDSKIEVGVDPFQRMSCKDKNSAALVCKAWKDVALDLIWAAQPISLAGLLRLLEVPNSAAMATNCRCGEDGRTSEHSTKAQANDERKGYFLQRARQIRTLLIRHPISAQAQALLRSLSLSGPLCPQVSSLLVEREIGATVSHDLVPYIIGGRVNLLSLVTCGEAQPALEENPINSMPGPPGAWHAPAWCRHILYDVMLTSPLSLRHLRMEQVSNSFDCSRYPVGLRSLQYSGVFEVETGMVVINSCPQLEEVILHHPSASGLADVHSPPSWLPGQPLTASNLRRLSIAGRRSRRTAQILSQTRFPLLESLNLNNPEVRYLEEPWTGPSGVWAVLSIGSPYLVELATNLYGPSTHGWLSALKSLRKLVIHYKQVYGIEFPINDQGISSIAEALPQLEELEILNNPYPLSDEPGHTGVLATHTALASLALHCPRLKTLRMGLSAREPLNGPYTAYPINFTPFIALETLRLDPLIMEENEVPALAPFLRKLCPGVAPECLHVAIPRPPLKQLTGSNRSGGLNFDESLEKSLKQAFATR